MRELPPLYRYDHSGKPRVWKVWADADMVFTEYGQIGGKMQTSSYKCEPKNVGRANATTAWQQAELEAQSLWQHKLDRRYFRDLKEAKAKEIKPMKAKKFQDRIGKEVKDGSKLYVQPKLDGIRMMAYWEDDELITIARSGKPINVPHIRQALEDLNWREGVLDGELYVHGKPFQKITSWVKRVQPNTMRINYCIYDLIPLAKEDEPWEKREVSLALLDTYLKEYSFSQHLKVVPTSVLDSISDVWAYAKQLTERGYEGAMVRLPKGKYEFAHRSKNLLKVKTFQDAEFEIVDIEEGIGKFEGAAIFVCRTPKGKRFNATPKGTMQERRQYFRDRESLIGQYAKVVFFEYSTEGIPRFPVAEGVRMPEDMDVEEGDNTHSS